MTIATADDPYLGVLSEFDAATAPAPPVNRRWRRLFAGVVSKAVLVHRREHRSNRKASAADGGDSRRTVPRVPRST